MMCTAKCLDSVFCSKAALYSNTACVPLGFQLSTPVQCNTESFYCSTSTTRSSDCRSCIRSSVSMPSSQCSGSRGCVECLHSFSPSHSEGNGPAFGSTRPLHSCTNACFPPEHICQRSPLPVFQSHSKLSACAVGFLLHKMPSRHP